MLVLVSLQSLGYVEPNKEPHRSSREVRNRVPTFFYSLFWWLALPFPNPKDYFENRKQNSLVSQKWLEKPREINHNCIKGTGGPSLASRPKHGPHGFEAVLESDLLPLKAPSLSTKKPTCFKEWKITRNPRPKLQGQTYCGCTKSVSHHRSEALEGVDSPVNTNKQWFQPWLPTGAKWILSIHSMWCCRRESNSEILKFSWLDSPRKVFSSSRPKGRKAFERPSKTQKNSLDVQSRSGK